MFTECSNLAKLDHAILACSNDSDGINCTFDCEDGYDFDLAFDGQKSETGLYIAEADFPLSGSWEILVRAEKDGTVYKESKKIFMRRK